MAVSSVFSTDMFSTKTNGLAYIILNVFPLNQKTRVIFSCLKTHRNEIVKYLKKNNFFDLKMLPNSLSKLILKKCENFVMASSVFDTFSQKQIEIIEKFFLFSVIDPDLNINDPRLYLFGRVE
ncbi:MAG: hypothetical protein L6Q53_04750 [Candidatus Brocadia sinica]|uniref:Uncharacterized protein n=1 Tax=Candidatus Brocadia sinica JPN1 TaxID=1197129 RepID=A0ABQ0JUS6_9BACT|nr:MULTISPECIES: hypothetical protein [Brocadia]MCK6467493.1 hypothetical protein [Candidatus Brocadia sinica]NOG41655.1 hypothetical protein [Planctomycetota bacterium]NUO06572.1 hypothetical protein [Candidatus Brocadia sinica]GAN32460.1 hypothetical protein BROSI_A0975 [Candidatus Brocadia sinica JPN1]GIK13998.1 MAG: hypothetical protein BroJett002_27050 [Candidatus Brocadia sinica]